MENFARLTLVNRLDLLREVHDTLKSDMNFWLRQKDWKRVAELRKRVKDCDERIASTLHRLAMQ